MIKKLLTYITGDVLVKGLGFLTLPLYSHLILPHEYGTLGLLKAIVAFLPVVLTLAYINGFVRFFFESTEQVVVSTFVYLGLVLNIVYFIVAMILYKFFIYRFDIDIQYFFLSILTSVLIFIFHILLVYYRSKSLASSYMKMTISYAIVGIILNFICLLLMEDNVMAMIIASLINTSIVSVIAFKILSRHINWKYIDFPLVKKILHFTTPLAFGAIGLLVFSQLDKILLAEYVSKEALGIYTIAFSIALAVSYLGNAFFMSYQPMFFQEAENNKDKIVQDYWKVVSFSIVSMLITFLTIIILYQFINVKYATGFKVSLIITTAYTFLIFAQMMALHLDYIKRTGIVALVYTIGGIVSLCSLYYFIPSYGIIGAAYSLFVGGLTMSILMYIFAQKYFYLAYNKKIVLLFYMFIFICFIFILEFI